MFMVWPVQRCCKDTRFMLPNETVRFSVMCRTRKKATYSTLGEKQVLWGGGGGWGTGGVEIVERGGQWLAS